MPASSKRTARVKKRKELEKHTGICKKAKRPKFDTAGETDAVAQDLGNRKRFHERDLLPVEPLNYNQEDFLQAYFQGVDLLMATGPAGTAKTFLSLYGALTDVFRGGSGFDQVIITRSTVPSRDQGFLPGTLEEKNQPFEAPYVQICNELLPRFNDAYNHLKSLGYLTFESTGFNRGVTWNNAIIIVDEFASCTYHELMTLITRVGKNSRIIFAGDFKQSDLDPSREESGYQKFLRVVEAMPRHRYEVVEYGLDDIVRSGLVRDILVSDYYNG